MEEDGRKIFSFSVRYDLDLWGSLRHRLRGGLRQSRHEAYFRVKRHLGIILRQEKVSLNLCGPTQLSGCCMSDRNLCQIGIYVHSELTYVRSEFMSIPN